MWIVVQIMIQTIAGMLFKAGPHFLRIFVSYIFIFERNSYYAAPNFL